MSQKYKMVIKRNSYKIEVPYSVAMTT